jgi:hypothetical protein
MSDFVTLQNYSTSAEAEFNAELLRADGVVVLLQGPQQGIFGAGFSGLSVHGVTLMVPAADYDRALELISNNEL